MRVCVARCGRVGGTYGVWACARVRACVHVPIQVGICVCVCARGPAHTLSLARCTCVCVCVCVTVVGHDVNAVQEYEMPYPLQKDAGEEEDAWVLKDGRGVVVLKLRFEV